MSMDNYHMLLSGSQRFSTSRSSLNMGNPQTHHFDAQNIGNESKAECKSQYPDNTNISDSGITSHSSGSEVKANSKGENKGLKKHRYAFQTRSQIDILDDGYRWRKYGQKTVKSGKFPRSYYKCTHKGCNVKKQIQRSSKDEEIVVTTYEGMHTHPIGKLADNFDQILRQMQANTATF
ncbi:probable WRKY transcription factor 43 [Pistacia vera]|uniref:probable WRKY transcription factor 43 n=1 Tax=Pistacia vera TaxID=55513 RepID=UPI001263AE3E|nr:probable WRKY transcription factor 43 [Pistacia vera]